MGAYGLKSSAVPQRVRLSEHLASHLTHLIVDDGLFAQRQVLPTERALGHWFGVGVGLYREATRSLAAIGHGGVPRGGLLTSPKANTGIRRHRCCC